MVWLITSQRMHLSYMICAEIKRFRRSSFNWCKKNYKIIYENILFVNSIKEHKCLKWTNTNAQNGPAICDGKLITKRYPLWFSKHIFLCMECTSILVHAHAHTQIFTCMVYAKKFHLCNNANVAFVGMDWDCSNMESYHRNVFVSSMTWQNAANTTFPKLCFREVVTSCGAVQLFDEWPSRCVLVLLVLTFVCYLLGLNFNKLNHDNDPHE